MNFSLTTNRFLSEFKANSRLRWGLWGIVGILWLYGILEVHDNFQLKVVAYRSLEKKVMRIKEIAMQEEWLSRQKTAQVLLLNLENQLWRENTIGLAQATFNEWLSQLTLQSNLSKVQLSVSAQEIEKEGENNQLKSNSALVFWKVSSKLAFDFNPTSLYQFLKRIELNEKKVIIESLVIHGAPTPRVELLLVAYYLKPAADLPDAVSKKNAKQ